MKIVALTGHTRGLGKSLSEAITSSGCAVRGFARASGYDISLKSDRDGSSVNLKTVRCSSTTLFNWLDNSQTDLLVELFYRWEERPDKTIVCIGSRVSDWAHRPMWTCATRSINQTLKRCS